jgi:hypothetical protein
MGGNKTKPSEAAADEAAAVPQKPDATKSDSL